MKAVALKLDGKQISLGSSRKVEDIIQIIKSLKKGAFLSSEGLAERAGCNVAAIHALVRRNADLFDSLRFKVSTPTAANKQVFGSVASIKALKKELIGE